MTTAERRPRQRDSDRDTEPSRAREIQRIFHRASELGVSDRARYLADVSSSIAEDVCGLLVADEKASGFLEQPLLEREQPEPPAEPIIPEHLGPYRPQHLIGEGGMSHVYLATRDDAEYERQVAIKVIRAELCNRDVIDRFLRERQILADLDHPNIAQMLDGGTTEEGLPYLVMAYVEGEPIDEYCENYRLGIPDRLRLFLDVCSAVQAAHTRLIVHRDLKTNNILVTAAGEPKLLDFGIAKLLKPDDFPLPADQTIAGIKPMTPSYASPEQVRGEAIGTTSDVYSLGVLLYKLLTGRLPYRTVLGTADEVRSAVLNQRPRPLAAAAMETFDEVAAESSKATGGDDTPQRPSPAAVRRLVAHLRGDLEVIVQKALRKETGRRYQSVEQLAADIRRYLQREPIAARADSFLYRAHRYLQRNRVGVSVAAGVATLLLTFTTVTVVQSKRIERQRDAAEQAHERSERVLGFLQSIFEVSDPHGAAGGAMTAREILDRGAEQVDKEFATEPETKAALLTTIANVYRNLGLQQNAERLLREAIAIPNDDPIERSRSMDALAISLGEQGHYEEAEPLLRDVLATRSRSLPREHPLVAESLNNLGVFLGVRGRLDEAEPLLRDALRRRRAHLPESHPDLAESLHNLGRLQREREQFADAERLFHEALALRKRYRGRHHPLVASTLRSLAVVLAETGRSGEAEKHYREALVLMEQSLGIEHPDFADCLRMYGALLLSTGRYLEAENALTRSLDVYRSTYSADHWRIAEGESYLGEALLFQGRKRAARSMLRRGYEGLRDSLGSKHPKSVEALARLDAATD